MKAIVVREFGAPEVMRLEEAETSAPAENQVLVKIEAVGVNPVETYMRSGNYPVKPNLPYTPGKDGAGIVESVGSAVTAWKLGDRVYTAGSDSGTYAEFSLCKETDLGRLPDNVSFEQGAGVWTPYATAYRALFEKASAKSGESVLIHGASGGVGIAAVQFAKNRGLTVVGTASTDEGKQLVSEQGADAVFDHSSPTYFDEIREFTNGGVDIVIEMLANVNLQRDFEILKMYGRISIVGNRGSLEFNPRVIMGKDAAIYGMSLFNARREVMIEIHDAIYEGLSSGYLNPIVSRTFPLAEAAVAHHEVIESKALGKIVLLP